MMMCVPPPIAPLLIPNGRHLTPTMIPCFPGGNPCYSQYFLPPAKPHRPPGGASCSLGGGQTPAMGPLSSPPADILNIQLFLMEYVLVEQCSPTFVHVLLFQMCCCFCLSLLSSSSASCARLVAAAAAMAMVVVVMSFTRVAAVGGRWAMGVMDEVG